MQAQQDPLARVISVEAAAELLGVSPRRVRVLCEAGRLVARRLGREWAVWEPSVRAFTPRPVGQPPRARP